MRDYKLSGIFAFRSVWEVAQICKSASQHKQELKCYMLSDSKAMTTALQYHEGAARVQTVSVTEQNLENPKVLPSLPFLVG